MVAEETPDLGDDALSLIEAAATLNADEIVDEASPGSCQELFVRTSARTQNAFSFGLEYLVPVGEWSGACRGLIRALQEFRALEVANVFHRLLIDRPDDPTNRAPLTVVTLRAALEKMGATRQGQNVLLIVPPALMDVELEIAAHRDLRHVAMRVCDYLNSIDGWFVILSGAKFRHVVDEPLTWRVSRGGDAGQIRMAIFCRERFECVNASKVFSSSPTSTVESVILHTAHHAMVE